MNSDLSDCGVVVDVRQAGLSDSDLIYSDFQAKSRVHREWPVVQNWITEDWSNVVWSDYSAAKFRW